MNFKVCGFIDTGCLCNDCDCQKRETKVVSCKRKNSCTIQAHLSMQTIYMNDKWYSYLCLYKIWNCSPPGMSGANFSLGFFVLKVLLKLGPAAVLPNTTQSVSCSDDCWGMTPQISKGLTSRHRPQKVTGADKSSFVPFQVTTLPNCMPFPIYLAE